MYTVRQKLSKLTKRFTRQKGAVWFGLLFLAVAVLVTAGLSRALPALAQGQSVNPSASQATYSDGSSAVEPDGSVNAATNPVNYFTKNFWIALFSSILLYLAQLGIKITLFLFTFIIQISAYNGYLDATAVNVGWVMVRDMTNMLFVIVLLMIAFGTILGIEQYEWKKLMVKFVLAAILVNFSRLICGILIDISQLVMTTFINGIVATSGGNLINAFQLTGIINLNSAVKPNELTSPGIFAASVMAMVFSAVTLYTIGIFAFILAARLIRLWVLIVLSPMAFVLSIIPSTQSASGRWWSEMMDNLVTGPVILFFIWLSFVTVGSGSVNTEISDNAANQIGQQYVIRNGSTIEADKFGGAQFAGVGDAMGWNQMASFIIAVGMLIAGAQVAESIGGSSGSALSGVSDFAKKVGTIASGVAAGKWLYGKGAQGASAIGGGIKAGAKYAALDLLPVRHYANQAKLWAQNQAAGFKSEAAKSVRMAQRIDPATGLGVVDAQGNPVMDIQNLDQAGQKSFFGKLRSGSLFSARTWGQAIATRSYRRQLARFEMEKTLEKTEHQAETREAILKSSIRGVPRHIFQEDWERGDTAAGRDADGIDRREEAILEGLKMRSTAKTSEHRARGLGALLNSQRVQYDGAQGAWVPRGGTDGTYGKEIAAHEIRAHAYEGMLKGIQAEAKINVLLGDATARNPNQLVNLLRASTMAQEAAAKSAAESEQFEKRVAREQLETLEGQTAIAERVAAEKAEHHEGEREELLRKRAETQFFEGAHGRAELEESARIALQTKELEARTARQKAEQEGVATAAMRNTLQRTQETELQTGAFQAVTKGVEAETKRAATENQADAVRAAEYAKVDIEAAEAATKEIEEARKAEVRTSPGARGQMEAAQRAQLRAGEYSGQQKLAEEEAKGTAMAMETASGVIRRVELTKLAMQNEQSSQKQLEAIARKEAANSAPGTALIESMSHSEIATSNADNLVKNVKNNYLRRKYTETKGRLKLIKTQADADALQASLAAAGDELATFIEATKNSQLAKESELFSGLVRSQVENMVDTLYVDMGSRGYGQESLAVASLLKSESQAANQAGDQGRAEMELRNLALVLAETRRARAAGREVDPVIALKAASTLIGVANGNNLDDALGKIEQKLNLYDSGADGRAELAASGLDDEQISELRNFATEFNLVRQNLNTGKYEGTNTQQAQAAMVQLQATGGDLGLMRTHREIEQVLIDLKRTNANATFNDAEKAYFSGLTVTQQAAKRAAGQYADISTYRQRYSDLQSVLSAAQEELKRAGVPAGHFQQMSGLKRDDATGLVRFTTTAEAFDEETTQKGKNERVKIAPQALGTLNTTTGVVALDQERLRTSNIVKQSSVLTFKNVMQDRTVDALIGTSLNGEKRMDGESILLGGTVEDLKKLGEGVDKELGVIRLLNDTLIPQLEESTMSIALAAHVKAGHTDKNQAEAGVIRGKIAAKIGEVEITANSGADIINSLLSKLPELQSRINDIRRESTLVNGNARLILERKAVELTTLRDRLTRDRSKLVAQAEVIENKINDATRGGGRRRPEAEEEPTE